MIHEHFNLSARNPIIAGHQAFGQPLLPGLAYIDLIYQAFNKHGFSFRQLELRNLAIHRPLLISGSKGVRLELIADRQMAGIWGIRLQGYQGHSSGDHWSPGESQLYAEAEMHLTEAAAFINDHLDFKPDRHAAPAVVPLERLYGEYREQQLVHTGWIKAEGMLYERPESMILDVRVAPDAEPSARQFLFHPALIDGSGVGAARFLAPPVSDEPRLYLPLYYESFRAVEPLQLQCHTLVRKDSVVRRNELISWTMEFFNSQGSKVAELRNFTVKRVREAGLISVDSRPEWNGNETIEEAVSGTGYPLASRESGGTLGSIEQFLVDILADRLGLAGDQIDRRAGYYELGLDSSGLLGMVKAMESRIGTPLSPTLLFEHTTIQELASYLEEHYHDIFMPPVPPDEQERQHDRKPSGKRRIQLPISGASKGSGSEGDIAIIGMAGRYPMAENMHEFWLNLLDGKNCVTEIPSSRWDRESMGHIKSPSGKDISTWGGFIDDPDAFDPKFFRISPREAETMDPQERLFLEVCWETMEDAGYTPDTIVPPHGINARRRVGVFAGVMHKDYSLIGADAMSRGETFPLSLQTGPIANRVSFYCDFHGPSMTVDTLCSSSLTAVHLAVESLRRGESEVALAGGINLSLHPAKYVTYGLWGMHSSDGRCRTFGKDGDGYVSSEGAGAVLLKPLGKAIEDRDRIYAVIKASSVNHVGSVSGFTVPGPVAQAEVIADCLSQAGIDPRTIGYIEAHGTGTSLGDPIEMEGLIRAFGGDSQDRQYCAIGSVKSNIGHAESAAGVIGLQKAALQIYHKTLVPSLHAEELNPYIDFDRSPFYVQNKTEAWMQPVVEQDGLQVTLPRRAGLSSFGATGSNAHLLLEEYVGPSRSTAQQDRNENQRVTRAAVPLSAKNSERLRAYAERILDYLLQGKKIGKIEERISAQQPLENRVKERLEAALRGYLARILFVRDDLIETGIPWGDYGIEPVHFGLLKETLRNELHIEMDESEWGQRSTVSSVADYLINEYAEQIQDTYGDAGLVGDVLQEDHTDQDNVFLQDLAYTLQVGRVSLEERILFVVDTVDELIQSLRAFLDGDEAWPGIFRGQVKPISSGPEAFRKEDIYLWEQTGDIERVANAWVLGTAVDWAGLYGNDKPNRISLPTYPFAKERYWIPVDMTVTSGPRQTIPVTNTIAPIHPLLHKNVSVFGEQRFETRLSGGEFFLTDHRVQGSKVLPGVAYLEMARAAAMYSLGRSAHKEASQGMRLKNIAWIRPFVADDSENKLTIRLFEDHSGRISFEIYSGGEGEGRVIHSSGRAETDESAASPPALDLDRILQVCRIQSLPSSNLYENFRLLGMEYGQTHQGIDVIHVGESQVLAKLLLKNGMSPGENGYVLHPGMMDSALQATIGLHKLSRTSSGHPSSTSNPLMPFALQEMELYAPCEAEMWAWIRQREDSTVTTQRLDIDLCDTSGRVCVRMKGFSTRVLEGALASRISDPNAKETQFNRNTKEMEERYHADEASQFNSGSDPHEEDADHLPESLVGNVHLIPVWDEVPGGTISALTPSPLKGGMLIVGGGRQADRIRRYFPDARVLVPAEEDSVSAISARLGNLSRIEHVVWIAPESKSGWADSEGWIQAQEQGILPLFRWIQAFLDRRYDEQPLQWTIITTETLPVSGKEQVQPAHAGVHGLAGSMVKEYANWSVRIADLESESNWPLDTLFSLSADRRGHPWAYRNGKWHKHSLIRVHAPVRPERSLLQTGGVYVVIGGAGGIGRAFSEYMVRTYQAHIVWIGRRQLDEGIRSEAGRLAAFGPEPEYLSADASSEDSLYEAYLHIKGKHARINGVIHSAMVLNDQELAGMSEESFRAALRAKVDVSVRLAKVFEEEPLDFVLFFSSLISFIKNAKQSHYASGSAFKDAFAHRMSQEWSCPVKIMNWGYWSSPEANASEEVKQLERIGMGLIEPADGMEAVELLLSAPFRQMAMIRTTRELVVEGMSTEDRVEVLPDSDSGSFSWLQQLPDRNQTVLDLEKGFVLAGEADDVLGSMLLSRLASMGMFHDISGTRDDFQKRTQISPRYTRWLEESLEALTRKGRLIRAGESYRLAEDVTQNPDFARSAWDEHKKQWVTDSSLKPWMSLAETMLEALPDILSGKIRATDMMFPNSSMRRVEGIYKNNPVADYFNEVLADSAVAILHEIWRRDPSYKVRLIEIGAGTGGTSSLLFRRLQPYQDRIEEYCYTDISKAFLHHAENEYGPHVSYLTYDLFNVDDPGTGWMNKKGRFDIAIAANVLHATRSTRRTLRHAKALLKKNGHLLINELSSSRLLAHLTFGLLEGWWLYDDPEIRIPGCPGLYPESWKSALESEGYGQVEFPAVHAHSLGQQIIAAASDGTIRIRTSVHGVDRSRTVGRKSFLSGTRNGPLAESGRSDVIHGQESKRVRTESDDQTSDAARTILAASQPSQAHDEEMISQRLEQHVREVIVDKLSEALKVHSQDIDLDESFADYGLDSIIGVHLVQILNQALNIELDTTTLFDYSSVRQLTTYILKDHREGAAGTLAEISPPASALNIGAEDELEDSGQESFGSMDYPTLESERFVSAQESGNPFDAQGWEEEREPIAIIGMSGRFAGSADVNELWDHLSRGEELIGTSPRWKLSDHYPPGSTFCEAGGFVDDIDQFDPFFFNINGLEATYMDPQQRVFLEECWKALEDSGYAGTRIQGSQCGVYVGCLGGSGDYSSLAGSERPPQAFWGMAGSVVPARIAYYLDLKGPAIAIDTACSSSLVAVHLACQGLRSGETDMALAGGVFLQSTPWYYLSTNKAGMLSAKGHSYTFDERADGFVPGEGAGVLVLKRLKEALADEDRIYGVIRGSGLNQDGTTNGITAPSALSQERLECGVYDKYDIDPSHIQVVEAHGTGTKLGDPIEYQAITRAFRKYTDRSGYCAIGSIKTNIGHAAHAAGVAGIIKILLALKHGQIPPTLNFHKGNPGISFGDSPFYVNTSLKEWTPEGQRPRLAAVSSFGFSGTNAHVVIEEAIAPKRVSASRPGHLIALSARTSEQLREQVRQLTDFMAEHKEAPLADISYTLLLGRKHLNHRFACVVKSEVELQSLLHGWLSDGYLQQQVFTASFQENERSERLTLKRYGNQCIHELQGIHEPDEYMERLTVVAELFVQGYVLDIEALYQGTGHTVVSLPSYPFEKGSYWISESSKEREAARTLHHLSGSPSERHPLLHDNVSDLSGVKYRSIITGNEDYLNKLQEKGSYRLLGAACLEMARAGAALSSNSLKLPAEDIVLRDVAWSKPLDLVQDGVTLELELFAEEDQTFAYEIRALPLAEGAQPEPVVLNQGSVLWEKIPEERADLSAIQARCSIQTWTKQEWYRSFETSDIRYAPEQRVIEGVWAGDGKALAKISADYLPNHQDHRMLIHPIVLDQALQLACAIDWTRVNPLREPIRFRAASLPITAAEIRIKDTGDRAMWVYVSLSGQDGGYSETRTIELDLYDSKGTLCARFGHFTVKMPERDFRSAVSISEMGEMR
ncbi:SDR family NAD(P)-dependent oxidoreductase [Paenibacillus sp. XY044]|uniref:SDR family NAD(P)-dependent oxidoreductase n=1 Tax=Paenibacillus sp. XY044 TaxID=2026089 RepID=UPI0015C60640|nr:SDR family NAD(P)-dependent oxidoreductase [Paenibacillus sp. XY044]